MNVYKLNSYKTISEQNYVNKMYVFIIQNIYIIWKRPNIFNSLFVAKYVCANLYNLL